MAQRHRGANSDRLTVTLAPGQREALEVIAERNNTALAFVVRYALRRFIEDHGQGRLPLEFPNGL